MYIKRSDGSGTVLPDKPICVISSASVVGNKEGEGPLAEYFDKIIEDERAGQDTFEHAESSFQKEAFAASMRKINMSADSLDCIFAGDLLSQCTPSSFNFKTAKTPFFGVFGACSTMAETLILASAYISAGAAKTAACVTSSHFCTAERQFRAPLEYGGLRPPYAQRTVTGSASVLLSDYDTAVGVRKIGKQSQKIASFTPGKIIDSGITDANNMGAAMAPAAFDTISAHLRNREISPSYYDLIITGDLGAVGAELLYTLMEKDFPGFRDRYNDCGLMIYDLKTQNVYSGGSGCGCSASVLGGYLLSKMRDGTLNRILFCATGALLSQISSSQGDTIPGICHAVEFSNY